MAALPTDPTGVVLACPACDRKNRVPWSGDHCSTSCELVPGILFVNKKVPAAPEGQPYTVRDVAATVMRHFGIDLAPLHGISQVASRAIENDIELQRCRQFLLIG